MNLEKTMERFGTPKSSGFWILSPSRITEEGYKFGGILMSTIDGTHYASGFAPDTSFAYLPRRCPRRWWLLSYVDGHAGNNKEVSLTQVAGLGRIGIQVYPNLKQMAAVDYSVRPLHCGEEWDSRGPVLSPSTGSVLLYGNLKSLWESLLWIQNVHNWQQEL